MSSKLYPVIRIQKIGNTTLHTECMGVFDMQYKALGFILEHCINAASVYPNRFEYSKPILNDYAYTGDALSYWIYRIEAQDKRDMDKNIDFYVLQTDISDLSSTYKFIEGKE